MYKKMIRELTRNECASATGLKMAVANQCEVKSA